MPKREPPPGSTDASAWRYRTRDRRPAKAGGGISETCRYVNTIFQSRVVNVREESYTILKRNATYLLPKKKRRPEATAKPLNYWGE